MFSGSRLRPSVYHKQMAFSLYRISLKRKDRKSYEIIKGDPYEAVSHLGLAPGAMLFGRSLLEDQRWFLNQVFLPAVERERPACVIIAGDIYDRQIAPVEAIRLFDEALARLMELGTKVCVIAGNHDGAGRMALLKTALARSGVYFATELADAFSPVTIEEDGISLQLFPLPYFDAAQAREFLGDGTLRGEGLCMKALLDRMIPLFQPGAGHVLVSHCFAAGAQTSDSESTLFVGGSAQVAALPVQRV